jgi:hypothetical protein
MKIRFQADYDLRSGIVKGLCHLRPAIDFRGGHEAGLEGMPDQEVLAIAASEGRMLVTHDFATMQDEFAEFLSTESSPGVILVPQHLEISIAIQELLTIWEASTPEEWVNTIFKIPL